MQPWTADEVRKAIKKMKAGKATGPDGIPVEAWRSLGELGVRWLTEFFNNITRSAKMPEAWRDSIIVPIFKRKGDAMNCTNYRGIKLIAHTMKIYERLLDMRLREMVEISPDQFGFVPERSTIDAIFTARQLMEKYREKNKPCHLAFLDSEKAYDRYLNRLGQFIDIFERVSLSDSMNYNDEEAYVLQMEYDRVYDALFSCDLHITLLGDGQNT
ncbi:hypothetical protein Y032_0025g1189 [Ancylostoma ceylanicum]|uniref:Reverse transcriptase domain-containing protein n=1 Tax=Ancylostoma ceylanicum TaxID=53326 RepID=A0A016UUN3_9BILA|nr:hypothetical protein Y032_0025g1189 [Ancylostoma ceylanicum]